jgi:hypothetical protein
VADFILRDDPARGQQHIEDVEAADQADIERFKATGQRPVTDYAMTNVHEHYADAFEAYYTQTRPDGIHVPAPTGAPGQLDDGNYDDLKANDRPFFDLLDTEMAMWENNPVHVGR